MIKLALATLATAQSHWWQTKPVRFFQTNLPENYSDLDSDKLVNSVDEFGANVLLFNLGGIATQYPTDMDCHYESRCLPEGRDLFGEVLDKSDAGSSR